MCSQGFKFTFISVILWFYLFWLLAPLLSLSKTTINLNSPQDFSQTTWFSNVTLAAAAAAASLRNSVPADLDMWCFSIALKASDFVAMALVLAVDWLSHPGESVHSPLTVEYWLQSVRVQRRVCERRVPKTHQSFFTMTHQLPSSLRTHKYMWVSSRQTSR